MLLHGTINKPGGAYDSGLIWGDYYLLEALLRYQKLHGVAFKITGGRAER